MVSGAKSGWHDAVEGVRHSSRDRSTATTLADGLMLQRQDGNQEVQGSPRFVQNLPRLGALAVMVTYLYHSERGAESQRESLNPHREDDLGLRVAQGQQA